MASADTPLFAVIRNGAIIMQTNSEHCIPPLEMLLSMKQRGYTFKYKGKNYIPKKEKSRV